MKQNRLFSAAVMILVGLNMACGANAGPRAGDTLDTLADPDALREQIPALKAMPHWTTFGTPEEIKLFEGEPIEWPLVPHSEYNLDGFDATMLGSKVPPPGVHPRILFSEEDLPLLYERAQNSAEGKRLLWTSKELVNQTLYDPESSDGEIYQKLVSGDLESLKWPDSEFIQNNRLPRFNFLFDGHESTWRHSPHHGYYSYMMNMALMLANFEQDDLRGKELANAVTNYWILREQVIDDLIEKAPKLLLEPADVFNTVRYAAGGDAIAYNYDLAAKWMSEDQKSIMRRIIAKLVNGRSAYFMNAPERWFLHNWAVWQTSEYTAMLLAIEGEEGYDPAPLERIAKQMEGYFAYSISEYGSNWESNVKAGFGFTTNLMAMLARHEIGPNFFGHPHYRNMVKAQAQWVMPQSVSEEAIVASSGTHCNSTLNTTAYFKTFFPNDKIADWLVRQRYPDQNEFDLEAYMRSNKDRVVRMDHRVNFIRPARFIYQCVDWTGFKDSHGAFLEKLDRTPLGLPLEFIDPIRGYMMVRSDDSPEAVFLHFEARDDLLFCGHNFNNAGMFQLTALGKVWSVIPQSKAFNANFNSVPRIDGQGYEFVPGNTRAPKVDFLPTVNNEKFVMGSADVKNAWDHIWGLQPYTPNNYQAVKDRKISLETDPEVVRFYRGTQQTKGRHRSSSGNYYAVNWAPTIRIETRPVQYAYRGAGLVKGEHPYVVVTDDLKMDREQRKYEWVMQVPLDVHVAEQSTPGEIVLKYGPDKELKPGTPLLLVKYLDDDPTFHSADTVHIELTEELVNADVYGKETKVLKIGKRDQQMHSRVLLIPYRHGLESPRVKVAPKAKTVTVEWEGDSQRDQLNFTVKENRTRLEVDRSQVEE